MISRAFTGRGPVIREIVVETAAPRRPAAAMVGQAQGKLVLILDYPMLDGDLGTKSQGRPTTVPSTILAAFSLMIKRSPGLRDPWTTEPRCLTGAGTASRSRSRRHIRQ